MAEFVRITGAEDLLRVSAALKRTGSRDLRRQMLAGIRMAAKPVVEGIKKQGDEELPAGVAEQYRAAKITSRTRTTGRAAGVRVQGPARGKGADMGRADSSGDVRHPVYGNRKAWSDTSVSPGFAERGAESAAPAATADMRAVLEETARAIARAV